MTVRIEWVRLRDMLSPRIHTRESGWVGSQDLEPDEAALILSTDDNVCVYGTREEVEAFCREVGDLAPQRPFTRTPEEHTHQAQDLGDGKHGVFALDPYEDDEQHYYVEHTVTAEGVTVDVFDVNGETLHYSLTQTWDEITAHAIRRAP